MIPTARSPKAENAVGRQITHDPCKQPCAFTWDLMRSSRMRPLASRKRSDMPEVAPGLLYPSTILACKPWKSSPRGSCHPAWLAAFLSPKSLHGVAFALSASKPRTSSTNRSNRPSCHASTKFVIAVYGSSHVQSQCRLLRQSP